MASEYVSTSKAAIMNMADRIKAGGEEAVARGSAGVFIFYSKLVFLNLKILKFDEFTF